MNEKLYFVSDLVFILPTEKYSSSESFLQCHGKKLKSQLAETCMIYFQTLTGDCKNKTQCVVTNSFKASCTTSGAMLFECNQVFQQLYHDWWSKNLVAREEVHVFVT